MELVRVGALRAGVTNNFGARSWRYREQRTAFWGVLWVYIAWWPLQWRR